MTPYNLLGITGTPKIFTVDTTAPSTYAAVGGGATSTSSAVKLQWYGSYSYVAISQSVNGGAYVDLSAVVVSTPYTVSDVSGNTALSYKITPYYSGVAGTAASVITVNTNVQAPRDLSAVYVDSSGALISFTVPKNTYSSSAVYTLRATDASGGTYKDVSGTSSPIWIQDLSEGTTYSVVAKTTLDGSASLVSSSSTLSATTLSLVKSTILLLGGETFYYPFNTGDIYNTTSVYQYSTGSASATNAATLLSGATTKVYSSIDASSTFIDGAISFNNVANGGNMQYVSIPIFTYSSNGLSIAFWVMNKDVNSGSLVNGYGGTFNNSSTSINLGMNSTVLVCQSNKSSGAWSSTLPYTFTSGVLYHIAYTWTSSSTNVIKGYVNGVYIGTFSNILTPTGTIDTMYLGNLAYATGSYYLNGWMDDFRFYNGKTLSDAEVSTLYFAKNKTSGLQFYYKFNSGDIVSNYVYNYATGTYDALLSSYSGGTLPSISTTTFEAGNGSILFDSANKQQMRLPGTIIPSTTEGITISLWMYDKGNSTFARAFQFISANSHFLNIYYGNPWVIQIRTSNDYAYNLPALTVNTWYHIAFTLTTTGTLTVYINGTYSGSTTTFAYPDASYNYNWISRSFDSDATTNYGFFNGYIDNFKLYNGSVLTATQITAVYNENRYLSAIPIYTAASTVSTFTTNTKVVSGVTGAYSYTNGTYIVSVSSYNTTFNGYYVANNNNGVALFWAAAYNGTINPNAPAYTKTPYIGTNTAYSGGGTAGTFYTTTVSGITCSGEWLQYQLPYTMALTTYAICNRNDYNQANRTPKIFWVAGSNDGVIWNLIDYQTNNPASLTLATYNLATPSSYYSYFRFIFNQLNGDYYLNLENINIFGYYGSSVSVPVVLYTFDYVVTNNGSGTNVTITGSPTFTGTGTTYSYDKINTGTFSLAIPNTSADDTTHYLTLPTIQFAVTSITMTMWYYSNVVTAGTNKALLYLAGTNALVLQRYGTNNIRVSVNTSDSQVSTSNTLGDNTWNFVSVVISNINTTTSNIYVYVNGSTTPDITYSSATFALSTTVAYSNNRIGTAYTGYTADSFCGYIDDFRIYDSVLTGSQISTIAY
jgi:hypothetical protein